MLGSIGLIVLGFAIGALAPGASAMIGGKTGLAWRARLFRAFGVLAFGSMAANTASAQTMVPDQAPAEWVRYATDATVTVTQWLQADSEAAQRLRNYLDATRPAPDQPTAPLVLKLWIERDGTVSRIDYPLFAHPEPNAGLHALLVGRRLAAKPPEGMLLPLRIALQLDAPGSAS